MKYAVIADIHANLAALKTVLSDSKAQGCERVICLDDVVGYGKNPRECLNLLRELDVPCVRGNHDEYCASEDDLSAFTGPAADGIRWTRGQLNRLDKEWLGSLDYVKQVEEFTFVHATLAGPQQWGYVFSPPDAASSFEQQATTVCFFGHTHVPLAFVRETTASGTPVIKGGTYSKFKIDRDKKYFVNPGSVGQPRDNNTKAAYAIYDLDEGTIELRRVDTPPDSGTSDAGVGVPTKPKPSPPTESNRNSP